jgi:hypothetical protein
VLQKFFRNRKYLKKPKLSSKSIIIDKTLTYSSGTWILTERDRKQINMLKGKCIEEF